MTAQLDMFGAPMELPRRTAMPDPKKPTIEERFEAFHKAHPHVLEQMMRLCRARTDRGERRIAVKALWEELRVALSRRERAYDGYDATFKLNNSFTALYARKLIELEPALADVIETRKRKAK